MGRATRVAAALAVAGVAAVAAGAWAVAEPEIPAVEPPDPAGFPADLVERGERLAAAGDCAVCHTAVGGEPYAGGLAMRTPFGTIYSSNITPDPETGIGRWSEAAFLRAMHEGVDREGRHLYPAFPYDHFARVTPEDISAIYAYLMSLDPVAHRPPETALRFPYGIRSLMAGWNLLHLEPGVYQPDPSRDEEWNRGAYLVKGLGHCASCHAERNGFGAVVEGDALGGGVVEGWYAPPLGAANSAPVPWTVDAMVNYLIDGWDEEHGIAAGPMLPVVNHLAVLPEEDVYAIAAYLVSLQEATAAARDAEAARAFAEERADGAAFDASLAGGDQDLLDGAATFGRICANCHKPAGVSAVQPAPLALAATVAGPDPRNAIRIILGGIRPPDGVPERSMPAFASLSDEDLADLLRYLRARFSEGPAWTDLEAHIRAAREGHGA